MSVSANIDGKSLLKALNAFPKNIQKNVMAGATLAGANVVKEEAGNRVRVKTGNLKASIGTTRRKSKGKNEIVFSVSPRKGGKNDGFYGRFIELGTSKMTAKPFLRPAFESKADEVLQRTKEYIAERLPEEVIKAKQLQKSI